MSSGVNNEDAPSGWTEDRCHGHLQSDRSTLYPLAVFVPYEQLASLGMYPDMADYIRSPEVSRAHVRARWTGEFRCPLKGEWFLSGAIVEAYCAVGDMAEPAHIAKLVPVESRTMKMVRPVPPTS